MELGIHVPFVLKGLAVLPSRTILAGPDLLCSTVFDFLLIFFIFILGRAVD